LQAVTDAGDIRASDAEREQTAEALREHYAAGRLDAQELSERLHGVYEAKTVAELASLSTDLPSLPISPSARRAELATRRVELRRRLVQRAGGSLSPFVICSVVWLASGADGSFWPAFLLIFPAVFLVRNAWRLYGPAPDLDRVHHELERRSGHRHRHRHRPGPGGERGELR
jgi:hypothetical protein